MSEQRLYFSVNLKIGVHFPISIEESPFVISFNEATQSKKNQISFLPDELETVTSMIREMNEKIQYHFFGSAINWSPAEKGSSIHLRFQEIIHKNIRNIEKLSEKSKASLRKAFTQIVQRLNESTCFDAIDLKFSWFDEGTGPGHGGVNSPLPEGSGPGQLSVRMPLPVEDEENVPGHPVLVCC